MLMPYPRGLLGLCLALTPLACNLMGWRGAGGTGAAGMFVEPNSPALHFILTVV
jgi:hypothetical protein